MCKGAMTSWMMTLVEALVAEPSLSTSFLQVLETLLLSMMGFSLLTRSVEMMKSCNASILPWIFCFSAAEVCVPTSCVMWSPISLRMSPGALGSKLSCMGLQRFLKGNSNVKVLLKSVCKP